MVRLGDLFNFKNGRSFKQTEWKEVGLPIIRIQNLNKVGAGFNFFDGEYDPAIEVNKNDLLFSWSGTVGSSFGPHIWQRDTGVLNQHIFKISFKTDMLLKYAFYSLLFITEEIERSVVGAVGLVHVTKKSLNEFKIPEPPIPEQKRIVAIIDQAFADIEQARAKTEQNLNNARELFESYLQQVFSQCGEGWVEKKLEELLDIGSSKRIYETDWTREGVPFFGGKEIVQLAKYGTATSNAYISEEKYLEYASKYDMPKKGDILMTARGTIGVGYIVKDGDKFYYKDGNIISLRPKEFTNSQFILYAFKSRQIIEQIQGLSGTTVNHLPLRKAKEILLNTPDFDAQNASVLRIEKMEANYLRLVRIYERKLRSIDELKKSILQKAFTGELTKEKEGASA